MIVQLVSEPPPKDFDIFAAFAECGLDKYVGSGQTLLCDIAIKWEKTMTAHTILEIEHIHEGYKIVVSRTGTVTVTPIQGKEVKELKDVPIPTQKFWDSLAAMIRNMNDHVVQLNARLQETSEQIVDLESRLEKAKEEGGKKYIPVGINRKNMFCAGVTFGRQQEKNSKCT